LALSKKNKTPKGINPEFQDEHGRFKAGNKAGNHYVNRRYHEIKTLILKNVTDEDVKDILKTAVEQAKQGDAEARKWLFERLIGKPKEQDALETTANQGWNILINVVDPNAIKPLEIIQTEAVNKTDIS
jgi:hypothetical protein